MMLSEMLQNIVVNFSVLMQFRPMPIVIGLFLLAIRNPLSRLFNEVDDDSMRFKFFMALFDSLTMCSLLWIGFGITSAKNPEFFYTSTKEGSVEYIFLLASTITAYIIHLKDMDVKQIFGLSKT